MELQENLYQTYCNILKEELVLAMGCTEPIAIAYAAALAAGTICDGAKSSCAAKISMAVEAGILSYEMFCNGKQFYDGEGIVKKGVENILHNVGKLARIGMRDTDKEIIKIILE